MSRITEGLGLAVGYGTGLTAGLEIVGNITNAFSSSEQAVAFGALTLLLGTGITYAGVKIGQALRRNS